jgi:hypothetical protein
MDVINTPETYRLQGGCGVVVFIFLANVKVMATPLAGASVGRGVEVEITVKHREQRG